MRINIIFILLFCLGVFGYSAIGDTPARPIPSQAGHGGEYLKTDGTNMSWNSVSGGSGTVTSVDASVPSYMSLSGNPITTSGTLAFDFISQASGKFFASPSGGSGAPDFRAIVAGDIPTLNQNTTGSASKWTTARNLAGNSVDGSGNVSFANKFIVQGTTDAGLSAAQFLGALGTGILKNTTTTGVLSIAVAGDFPLLNQSTSGNAATATALASDPSGCSANNYANEIDASGNLTCAQVAYSQLTGAPSLHYQTVQTATTPVTQRSNLNFTSNFTLGDSAGSDRTTVELASTITANVIGNLTGNADTATKLATPRAINGTNFDGTSPITVTADANTLTGTVLHSTVVTSSLTSVGTIGTGVWQGSIVQPTYGGTGQSTLTGLNIPSLATDIVTFAGQGSAPTSPSAGNFKLYADTNNGRFKIKDSSGNIFDVGITWLINYARDLFGGTSLNGINAYNDGASALPVDGTGGTATGLSTTLNSSSPVQSPSNIRFSKDAANRQGDGWSWDVTLDRADFESGRPVPITFFQRTSVNYVAGDIKIFIYDKTASSLLSSGASCLSNSDGSASLPFTAISTPVMCYFYPNTAHSDYRIIFHITSANATAWDFDVARLKINPDDRLLVAPTGPVGEIIALGSSTAPANFIAADGSAISRTDFAELFGVIGTTYGSGNGTTTFNVPNGSGVFLRGVGTQTIGGVATPTIVLGTTQGDQFQDHAHPWGLDVGNVTNGSNTVGASTFNHTFAFGGTGLNGTVNANAGAALNATTAGGGTPRIGSETRPANVGVKFYIRYTSQSNVLSGTALTLQTPLPTIASSSIKTPTASGNWNLMTGNSLTLTTGMWRLSGACIFNASGSPAYTQTDCMWNGANGNDTGTPPATIGTVTGITVYAGLFENYTLLATGTLSAQYPPAPVAVVKCTAPTCVVYLDTYSVETTASAARISVVPNAEKIPDFTIYGVAGTATTTGSNIPILPTIQTLATTSVSTYNLTRVFTVSPASATSGATYTNNGCTFTVWSNLISGIQLRTTAGSCDAASSGVLVKTSGTGDSTISFSAYYKPVSLWVRMVGGGGGGGSSGTGATGGDGTAGSSSFFNGFSATGGGGGQRSSTGAHANAAPGNGSVGCDPGLPGQYGTVYANGAASNLAGPNGGSSLLGAGGTGGNPNIGTAAANAGYGGGGGGAGGGASVQQGQSGAGGGYCELNIQSPSNTYSFQMGAAGTGGSAGTSGGGGANGTQGIAIVTEKYNY